MPLISQTYDKFSAFVKHWPRFSLFLGAALFVYSIVIIGINAIDWGLFGELPTEDQLKAVSVPVASKIYSIDGELIGQYFLEERNPVGYDVLPQHLIDALIATEDARFYEHDGMDGQSLMRVLFKTILLQDERAGGGSTITQQLAKNLYPREDFGLLSLPINKIKETLTAQRMEEVFTKDQIITQYLNTVSFGENAFGISVASKRFFGVVPADLKAEESAVLVGMLKAPTSYNPRRNKDRSLQRRNLVLAQMEKYGFLNASKKDSLASVPLTINYSRKTHHDGIAPYFREYLRQYMMQWCKTHPKKDGSYWNLYTDGLKIYTPLHAGLQRHAEAAMTHTMQRIQRNFDIDWRWHPKEKISDDLITQLIQRSHRYKSLRTQEKSEAEIDSIFHAPIPTLAFDWQGDTILNISPLDSILRKAYQLQTGLLVMDPNSGSIRAWVGGINHHHFQYDHVLARRQSGSAFKPIVFASALESGIAPCEYIPNEKVVFERYDNWTPQNADQQFGGEYSMTGALTYSVNVAAVNLLMKVGMNRVVSMGKKLGIHSPMPAVPSLALGTAEVSLLDMLSVYNTFVNGGLSSQPVSVLRIEDAHGNLLDESSQTFIPDTVLSPNTAITMSHMLQNVVNQGTGRSLRTRYRFKQDIAGKTGTTQSQTDGWFIGAMPGLSAGVWVGADDQRVHFRSMRMGQGASTALPLWANFVQRVMDDSEFEYLKDMRFPSPSPTIKESLNCEHLWFPLAMSEFKAWWEANHPEDSTAFQVGNGQ
ncbi:MAG: transglycosylase domain-containing protein [Bacteroidota bacterium]